MLTTPPQQSKQLDVEEVPIPAGVYELRRMNTTDTVNHSDYELNMDTAMSQSAFSIGVGTREFNDKADETAYWWSSGILTHAGKSYLPPPVTSKTLTSGASALVGFTSYVASGGTRYDFAWQGTRIYQRNASNTSNGWVLVYTADVPVTNVKIVNGTALIAVPTHLDATSPANTDFYIQSDPTAGATWTPTAKAHAAFSDALGKPTLFQQERGTTFAFVSPRKVYFTVDPSTDSWAGPIDTTLANNISGPPGDTTYGFTGSIAVNDFLMAFKADGGYNIDANQEVTNVLWQWMDKPDPTNFKYYAAGVDQLYYSVTPAVYAYDPNTGRNTNTGISMAEGYSIQNVLGVAADNNFAYVAAAVQVPNLRATPSYAILRGTRVSTAQWAWEVVYEDTGSVAYDGLYASPQGHGTRLYFATSDGTTIKHIDFPPDWDESTTGSFAAAGDLYMAIWRTGFANFNKRWAWIAVNLENTSATNTFNIAYSTDLGLTFTSLSTVTANGLTFIDMTGIESPTIVLRFHFVSAGTVTPVFQVYDLHGRVRFRYLKQAKAIIRVADYIELNGGTKSTMSTVDIKTAVELARTTDLPITYKDFLGNSYTCSVESLGMHPTRHEVPTNQYELECQLTISELGKGT